MKNLFLKLPLLVVTLLAISCNNNNTEKSDPATDTKAKDSTVAEVANPGELAPDTLSKGDYCFLSAENRDTTTVRIRILSDDDIRGEMIWNPWQKDGAVGTLTGKKISKNEMELLYSYTIEGNRQKETKIMKVEKQMLYIKKGELIDAKKDGNLVLKDAAKATYIDSLAKINCDL